MHEALLASFFFVTYEMHEHSTSQPTYNIDLLRTYSIELFPGIHHHHEGREIDGMNPIVW